MQIEFGSQRLNEQPAGRIVDKKRHVQSFVRNFLPVLLLARALLPGNRVVKEARLACDGCWQSVWTSGCAVDFDQSHCGAADLGGGSAQQQALAREQTKPDDEKIQTTNNRDQRRNREVVARDE